MLKYISLGLFAILIMAMFLGSFPILSPTPSLAATASTSFSFKQSTGTGEEGTTLRVTVIAPDTLTQTTRVRIKLTGGTAKSGTDFRLPTTQTMTFYKGGLKEKSISITLRNDSIQEPPETLTLGLFSQNNQSLNQSVTLTIADKGAVPSPSSLTTVDINAVPTDTGLDARGWARYLNVPSDCPRPETGKTYRHFFDYSRKENVLSDTDFKKVIARWVNTPRLGSGTGYLHTTDDVIYAIPIIASVPQEFGNSSPRLDIGNEQTGFGIQSIISAGFNRCPGVIADEWQGLGGAVAVINDENASFGSVGQIKPFKPHETFYLNIRHQRGNGIRTGDVSKLEEFSCDQRVLDMFADSAAGNNSVTTWFKRNGKYLCSTLFSSDAESQYTQPYTGPCLSQAPYPINYDSRTCIGSKDSGFEIPLSDSAATRFRCFDTLNKHPEIRVELKNTGGRTLLIEGSNKKMYSSYACVSGSNWNDSNQPVAWDKVPTHQICAKHSEGFTRITDYFDNTGFADTSSWKRDERKCELDPSKGYYKWKLVSNSTIYANAPQANLYKKEWFNANGTLLESDTRDSHYLLGNTRNKR